MNSRFKITDPYSYLNGYTVTLLGFTRNGSELIVLVDGFDDYPDLATLTYAYTELESIDA